MADWQLWLGYNHQELQMPDLWPQDSSSLPPAPAPVTAGHQQAQCVHHCHTVTTTGPMGMPPSRTALPAPGLRPVSSLPPPAAHAAADDGAAGTGAAESSSTSAAAGQHSRPVSTSRRPLARSISAPNAGRTLTKSGNASRRYRERQRTMMQSMEAEVADKLAQLQLLTAENDMLQLRSAVLESTTSIAEGMMRVASENGIPSFNSTDSATPRSTDAQQQAGAGLTACNTSAVPGAAACAHMAPAAAEAAAAMASAAPVPAGWHVGGMPQGSCIPGPGRPSITGHAAAGHGASPSSCPGSAAGASRMGSSSDATEVIKQMNIDDFVQRWRQFMVQFSDVLLIAQRETLAAPVQPQSSAISETCPAAVAAAAAATSAADGADAGAPASHTAAGGSSKQAISSLSEERLTTLNARCWEMLEMMSVLNPATFFQVFGRNLDTGLPVAYDDEHWRRVVGVLELSELQLRHIYAYAELYLPDIHKLHQERLALQQQLQSTGSTSVLQLIEKASAARGADFDAAMQAALSSLTVNLEKEHMMRYMLATFVWNHVFNSLQKAQVAVYSHPLFFDIHAILWVLIQDSMAAREAAGLPPKWVFPHRHDLRGLIDQQHRQAQRRIEQQALQQLQMVV